MKALNIEVQRMVSNEKRNRAHARSLMRGWSYKRHAEWLTENMLVASMAAYGHVRVCRLVKDATNEEEYSKGMRAA